MNNICVFSGEARKKNHRVLIVKLVSTVLNASVQNASISVHKTINASVHTINSSHFMAHKYSQIFSTLFGILLSYLDKYTLNVFSKTFIVKYQQRFQTMAMRYEHPECISMQPFNCLRLLPHHKSVGSI